MLTKQVSGRVYNYDFCIGMFALVGNGFYMPLDFALGSEDTMYVVHRGSEFQPSHGISKCTFNHVNLWDDRSGDFGKGESVWPSSLDVDSKENVYVSDDAVNRIFISDKDGNSVGSWGKAGSGDGELNGPWGLAFDKEDNLYIVDGLNSRIQKFTKDGKFLSKWGSQGSGEGQFDMPWGITIDKAGDVYVADWNNNRIQKFSPDGKYLASFGRLGSGPGELQRPSGVAVDSDGDVYVTDWGNNRLNVYASDGSFITSFIGDAQELSPWAQASVDANPDYQKARRRTDLTPEWRFGRPVAVNVDAKGRIMVLETQRCRVQVYVKEQEFVDAPFNL
jgi:DNA-binding beta-propeller fold protein YncE